ncbi:DUF4913 domain-containing protein [Streptomyces niveus]|uniref:DUF4913 domain-containing protein n=1 Tax=Streptomyces niveus TaxID=193462 RepID=UPI0036C2E59E
MTSPLHDEERGESAEDIRQDEESAERAAGLFYGNVNEFVTDRFIYFVQRPNAASGQVWCPEWYRHAQALSRLDSVWRAWEALRWDAGMGLSSWWLNHADPHLRALLDPVTGPFANCADGHQDPRPLPVMDPPEGLFSDQREPGGRDPFSLD